MVGTICTLSKRIASKNITTVKAIFTASLIHKPSITL